MTCPDEECHKRGDGHQTALFGKDGRGGVVGCLAKKISWKSAGTFFGIILLFSGAFILYNMTNEKEQNAILNKHEVQIQSIKEDTNEIKKTLEKQITIEQLKNVINEALSATYR